MVTASLARVTKKNGKVAVPKNSSANKRHLTLTIRNLWPVSKKKKNGGKKKTDTPPFKRTKGKGRGVIKPPEDEKRGTPGK